MRASVMGWRSVLILLVCSMSVPIGAEGEEILPQEVSYDVSIPTVEEVLGQSVGRWHLRHDQLVAYMEAVAESSPRMRFVEQGRTHEGRRQTLLIVTSPENHARLDDILQQRLALTDASLPALSESDLEAMPSVAYLGYSIHGNEASGSNASPLVAYYLAAAQSAEVDSWLDNTVVLIDPSLNPDGMGRFASWANMHRGSRAVGDPDHREHREGWPSGRTNHYWFDLNRDWLLLQHPESRNRVASFHRWKPNLLGDYHEMGSNSTYFFQPGVAERENPYKPMRNIELTQALAVLHARNLDSDGQLYYSGETFDDFYPGKGSTYPDLNGSVGVLFEQASARGHVQDTVNGELTFERAIKNHFLTSLSMVEGAATMRRELLDYQIDFYREAGDLAAADTTAAYAFGCAHDRARCWQLVELLRGHQIEVHEMTRGIDLGEQVLDPSWSWVVPLDQPQYRLIKALFERQTEFRDSTFYDISTWTMPLAFGAVSTTVDQASASAGLIGDPVDITSAPQGEFATDPEAYAYLFEWSSYFAPRSLQRLFDAGFKPRLVTEGIQAEVPGGVRDFPRGTIMVPLGDGSRRDELEELLALAAREDGVDVWATRTGLTASGVDFGSPTVRALEEVRLLLVAGRGTSSYEVGEAWHLLDQRFQIPLSLIELDALGSIDMSDYTHVLMVNGSYDGMDESTLGTLRSWVSGGGVLVATKGAAAWAADVLMADPTAGAVDEVGESVAQPAAVVAEPEASDERRSYGDYDRERAAQLVSGAIFEVELDLTHPIAFGYWHRRLPVFRNSTLELDESENPYERVALYSSEPHLSGYVSDEKLDELRGQPAIQVSRMGAGTVVQMVDNPNFRAFWYGTSKLYLNAIFFGASVDNTSPPGDW